MLIKQNKTKYELNKNQINGYNLPELSVDFGMLCFFYLTEIREFI